MSNDLKLPRVSYVMGIDGSGKTTVSEHLSNKMTARGYKVKSHWLRFNHVISKPLLGLCRVIGLTRYETVNGIQVGYHDFHRSKIISWLFIFVQYLDAVRVKFLKVNPSASGTKSVLILDRYVYDILVDVMVDTKMHSLHKSWIGHAFINLLPRNSKVILVDRTLEEVLIVRPEGKVDDNFESRFYFYQQLKYNEDIYVITNNGTLDELLAKAEYCAGLRS